MSWPAPKLGSPEWKAQYVKDNTFWKRKRAFWFHASTGSHEVIWPLQQGWIKILRLPGRWQKDKIEWFSNADYTFLFLKGDVIG